MAHSRGPSMDHPGLGERPVHPGLDLGGKRSVWPRPGRVEIRFYRHDQAARARPWPAAAAARPGPEPSTGPAARRSRRTARPAPGRRCRPPRTAPAPGRAARPAAGPGQRLGRAVDADHGAVGSHQVGGHERHVPGPAAQIQHPHAGRMPASAKIIRVAGASAVPWISRRATSSHRCRCRTGSRSRRHPSRSLPLRRSGAIRGPARAKASAGLLATASAPGCRRRAGRDG